MGHNEKKKIGDLEVFSVKGNHSAAFLVKVDGFSIFHSGDHDERNIDFLGENVESTDIMLRSYTGSWHNDIIFYMAGKLNPNVIFPMHVAGAWGFHWKNFVKDAKGKINAKVHVAEYRGDRFFYNNGRINE